MSKVSSKSLVAFPLLTEAAEFLKALPEDWCFGGGWALDLFQRKVTRKHQDLDLCVLSLNETSVVSYFLDRGWRVEAKLGRGFVPIAALTDWSEQMPYFWSSAPGSDFLPSYLDDQGIRKLRYERKEQLRMDFAELYFAQIENGCIIYPQDASIRRPIRRAVLEHAGFCFLAPEWVFLFKADWPKDKVSSSPDLRQSR